MAEQDTSFGPNAWLVDEMYEQYRADPSSVSQSWQEFFADYRPDDQPAPPVSAPPAVPAAPAASVASVAVPAASARVREEAAAAPPPPVDRASASRLRSRWGRQPGTAPPARGRPPRPVLRFHPCGSRRRTPASSRSPRTGPGGTARTSRRRARRSVRTRWGLGHRPWRPSIVLVAVALPRKADTVSRYGIGV